MPLQVCEYMNGGTLSNIIREQGKQSLAETVRVITAMCAALVEAHGLGIVHRDIKPQNILFGSVGSNRLPKLADFGIAKWSAETKTRKQQRAEDTAIVAGQKLAMYSPSWAAPEQLAGQPVSPGTDIYSLACVAIYMLSGKAIFADEDVYAGYKKRRHAEEHVREALAPLGDPGRGDRRADARARVRSEEAASKVDELSAELHDRDRTDDRRAAAPATGSAAAAEPPRRSPSRRRLAGATRSPSRRHPQDAAGVSAAAREGRSSTRRRPSRRAPPPSAPRPTRTPAADLTPQTFHAPPASRRGCSAAPPRVERPGRRLALSDVPQPVADRRAHFVMRRGIDGPRRPHGTKVRVSSYPARPEIASSTSKGLTCFVALLGGRPSPAVTSTARRDVALVTPRAQEIGHLRIAQGRRGRPSHVQVGNEMVAVERGL